MVLKSNQIHQAESTPQSSPLSGVDADSGLLINPPHNPVSIVSILTDFTFELARIATAAHLETTKSYLLFEIINSFVERVRESLPDDSIYGEVHDSVSSLAMLTGMISPPINDQSLHHKLIPCLEWISSSIEYALQYSKNTFLGKLSESYWTRTFSSYRDNLKHQEGIDDSRKSVSPPHSREVLTEYELQTPVRLLGAELEFIFHRMQEYRNNWDGDDLELPRFYNHLLCFISDLRVGQLDKERTPYSVATIAALSLIGSLTIQLEERTIGCAEFEDSVWKVYQELSQVTIFRGYPEKCKHLQLTLLEFSTDFSGLPHFLIPTVQKLDSGVLINPSLKVQQDGLGREMLTNEAEKLLRSMGARLFVIKSGREPIGYDMFLPNAPLKVLPGTDLIQDLIQKGVLKEDKTSNIGFLRSVVVPPGKRLAFAKAGINAYDLLDDLMGQVAIFENCESMVCTVRVGDNPNVSRKAHERRRWKATGYIIRDIIPGAAPLEVFVRDPYDSILLPSDFFPADRTPPLGFRPHFNPYRPEEIEIEKYEGASCLSDKEGILRVINAFELAHEGYSCQTDEDLKDIHRALVECGIIPKISSYYGSLQRYITIQSSSHLFNLHQLRPGFDYWYLTSDETTGTIDECIERIDRELSGWKHLPNPTNWDE